MCHILLEWLLSSFHCILLLCRFDDQWITTISLLQHRICSVPADNGLWNHPGAKLRIEKELSKVRLG
jgi:hypothetical protein